MLFAYNNFVCLWKNIAQWFSESSFRSTFIQQFQLHPGKVSHKYNNLMGRVTLDFAERSSKGYQYKKKHFGLSNSIAKLHVSKEVYASICIKGV